jgi:hypothetical protein
MKKLFGSYLCPFFCSFGCELLFLVELFPVSCDFPSSFEVSCSAVSTHARLRFPVASARFSCANTVTTARLRLVPREHSGWRDSFLFPLHCVRWPSQLIWGASFGVVSLLSTGSSCACRIWPQPECASAAWVQLGVRWSPDRTGCHFDLFRLVSRCAPVRPSPRIESKGPSTGQLRPLPSSFRFPASGDCSSTRRAPAVGLFSVRPGQRPAPKPSFRFFPPILRHLRILCMVCWRCSHWLCSWAVRSNDSEFSYFKLNLHRLF